VNPDWNNENKDQLRLEALEAYALRQRGSFNTADYTLKLNLFNPLGIDSSLSADLLIGLGIWDCNKRNYWSRLAVERHSSFSDDLEACAKMLATQAASSMCFEYRFPSTCIVVKSNH
jgi:hypothetical protein